jgi:hypothetical protein
MRRILPALVLLVSLVAGAPSQALLLKQKIRLIESDRLPAGSKVTLRQDELNAYVRSQVRYVVRDGIRDPRLELGNNRASGYAYVDFARLRQSQGMPLNWFMTKLLGGERPVQVDARIRSGNGRAVVDLDRVTVSGIAISGPALDYLIRNFLWPYYPEAKIGRPFELTHRIDRFEVQPSQVNVVIRK